MKSNINLIFGPPGTGKTFDLIRVIEGAIDSGIGSAEICFITFTRKAASEARERVMEKFNLVAEQIPWFSTFHALAFKQGMYNRGNVMGLNDYLKLCEQLGLFITTKGVSFEDGTFSGQTLGDRLFFTENMARARMMDLRTYWEQYPDEDIYWYQLLQFQETLDKYKRENHKKDFTDLIHDFCELDVPLPPCRLLLIDEAQDQSPLQWRMARKLMGHIGHTFIAGDDDQAIFRWAGADVDYLINMEGDRRVLDQSYRVPRAIQQVADRIASRITHRVPKVWKSRDAEGSVEYESEFYNVDMSQGTWLLLARNAFLLDYYAQACLTQGLLFESSTGLTPLRGGVIDAIRWWESLRKGEKLRFSQVKSLYEFMSTRVGVAYGFKGAMDKMPDKELVDLGTLRDKHGLLIGENKTWEEALDRLKPNEVMYFQNALARDTEGKVRIRISTIHSVKGGEADNVVLQTDMAERTWNEYHVSPDDEHRVWYVAVTRAKERLIILQPRTNKCYDI